MDVEEEKDVSIQICVVVTKSMRKEMDKRVSQGLYRSRSELGKEAIKKELDKIREKRKEEGKEDEDNELGVV
jgi:Arc/MetJ-type ribon-helix-helix transcriptional regulator